MEKQEFKRFADRCGDVIAEIRISAHNLHDSVNQKYGKVHPYGYHLDMVADGVRRFGYAVCDSEEDIVPLFFGAYYHDSIEDARLSYNDVMRIAARWMTDEQALMATEMVHALTNEKGRTRAERANDKYYQGIRETPYAPFLKLADRLANTTFSSCQADNGNNRMKQLYHAELPHFLGAISSDNFDRCFSLPDSMVKELRDICQTE